MEAPEKITLFSDANRREIEYGVVSCEACGHKGVYIYDGGGTSGCSGGYLAGWCPGCGHKQIVMDDCG